MITQTTILLSSFNGEKYLSQQIDSILEQTDSNWELLIRDDGSTDRTNNIIDDYVHRYEGKIKRLPSSENVGVIHSFELLLQACESEYIFLCDQDDYWLPNKVELTKKRLQEFEKKHPGRPACVFTDLVVVNEHLETIHSSFWEYSKIEPSLLTSFDNICVHPVATGCTMLINKQAKDCALPFGKRVRMHDSWIILSILKKGGVAIALNEQTMLYRQHQGNVVGAINENNSYLITRIKGFKQVVANNKKQWNMIKELGFKSPLKYLYLKTIYHIKYGLNKKKN